MGPSVHRSTLTGPEFKMCEERISREPMGQCQHAAPISRTMVLDTPLAIATYSEIQALVCKHLRSSCGRPLTIDAINTMGVASACKSSDLHTAMNEYDLLVPDGMPLVWCANAKGAQLRDRVYGPYLASSILGGLDDGTRVAVVGGDSETHINLQRLAPRLFPRARFVSFDASDFSRVDKYTVRNSLERALVADAQLIFVCLGVPKQYLWVAEAVQYPTTPTMGSIGGALDFVVGNKQVAPPLMQRNGLTWLHRALAEPRLLIPLYLRFNSQFLWLIWSQEIMKGTLNPWRMVSGELERRRELRSLAVSD